MDPSAELWLASREAVQQSIQDAEVAVLQEDRDDCVELGRKLERIQSYALRATRLFFYETLLTDHHPRIRKSQGGASAKI